MDEAKLAELIEKAISNALVKGPAQDEKVARHERAHEYLDLLMLREEKKLAFRNAVIKHGTMTLLGAGVVWLLKLFVEYISTHWR